jgi:FAD/FMN-containing dehydrogenase
MRSKLLQPCLQPLRRLTHRFELMPRFGVEITARHIDGVRDPLEAAYPWYVLIDISTSDSAETARADDEWRAGTGLRGRARADAAIAALPSRSKSALLAYAREHVGRTEAGRRLDQARRFGAGVEGAALHGGGRRGCRGGNAGCAPAPSAIWATATSTTISQPVGADKDAFIARWHEMNHIVHGLVLAHGGSISAEHGIGS